MASFLTSQQVQAMINVDLSTVYRMAEDGRLPGIKIGRQWRFPADRVAELLGVNVRPDDVRSPARLAVVPAPSEPPAHRAPAPRLEQLLVPEVAQSIADLIGETLGTMAVITDMDGVPLTDVANPCGYYAAIAERPGATELCLTEWRQFADEPHVAPRFVRTQLGFLCARTYVWVDLAPVGMILTGGVRPPVWPPSPATLATLATELAIPLDDVADAAQHVWELDDGERRRALRLLPQFGDIVSQLASARHQLLALTDASFPIPSRPPEARTS